jgi:hypothetical protein
LKKIIFAVLLAVAMTMLLTGTAFADFAIHGGYVSDTDACAGCHRAHTSFSNVGRTNYASGTRVDNGSALLVGSATSMKEFCLTCHGALAPGASTDVVTGVFDGASGPSAAIGGAANLYQTNSVDLAGLNGGAFNGATSQHDCDVSGARDPLWGTGNSAADFPGFTCTSCHDPHGSTNYRLLKDQVGPDNAVVGGYSGTTPQPFVLSAELGYPSGGWSKSTANADMQNYFPDYTTPRYRASDANGLAAGKGMSGWCSGCHTQYDVTNGARTSGQTPSQATTNPALAASKYNYGSGETQWGTGDASATLWPKPTYNAAPGGNSVGAQVRHRHPVNIDLTAGYGISNSLAVQVNTGNSLFSGHTAAATEVTGTPLELAYNKTYDGTQIANSSDDVIGCLTCHKAHGTDVQMQGWARGRLVYNAAATVEWSVAPGSNTLASDGVNPNASTALLRANNRGVCENCHNK